MERLVFFSDAVMAIAITLLALDIRLPATDVPLTNATLLSQLLAIGPKYFSYIISFLVVGLYWLAHNRLYRNVRRYDSRLPWLNFLFLMLIAFLPFPTSVISEHGNAVGTIFYALNVALTGLAMAGMWWYAQSKPQLLRQPCTPRQFRLGLMRLLVPPAVFAISIPVALWNADAAKFFWVATALGAFFRSPEVPPQD